MDIIWKSPWTLIPGTLWIVTLTSLGVVLFFRNRRESGLRKKLRDQEQRVRKLTKDLQEVEESKNRQRSSFEKYHKDYVERLRKEVNLREQRISELQVQLKSLKDKGHAEDVAQSIRVLVSERDALKRELSLDETEPAHPKMTLDLELVYALKHEITRLKVENSRFHSLFSEYKNRYQDMLQFGNKIKMENRNLQEQIQKLMEKMAGPIRGKKRGGSG